MHIYSAADYLRIDIASHFGLDKEVFPVRIAWVTEHEHELEDLENDADDYFMYAAAVMAYRKAQKGIPTGYMVGLDACASGPQILSAWIGCLTGATNTGAVGNRRADVYGTQKETMEEILEEKLEYSRSQVKYSFMPHYYGSKQEPIKLFGEDTPELSAFLQGTALVCPGAEYLLKLVNSLWDPEALEYNWNLPDGFHVKCKVKVKVDQKIEIDTLEKHPIFYYRHTINQNTEKGLFLIANLTHGGDGFVVRELTRRCDYKRDELKAAESLLVARLKYVGNVIKPDGYLQPERLWKEHEFMSLEAVKFVNQWSIDHMNLDFCAALLRLIRRQLKRPSFHVISVHDRFACHANYMNYCRQTYIDILAEMADSNMLNTMLSGIAGYAIKVPKMHPDLGSLIRESEYPIA